MDNAGIDTTKYRGHSTRGAATSNLSSKGFSVAEILARANWSSERTFNKFYRR